MYPTAPHEQVSSAAHGVLPNTSLPETHSPPQAHGVPKTSLPETPSFRPRNPWSTGLCHCCDDPANCIVTCFCPCITFGQIAEILGKGSSSCATSGAVYCLLALTGFACLCSCFYRSKLRAQYDLQESPCVDCLVHFCCEACALSQEYRELKNLGFDMGVGWKANMKRQKRSMTVPPAVDPGMTR